MSRVNHRLNSDRTYKSWQAMRSRCLNPNVLNYKDYGGRGITVCDRWVGKHGFENFLADMGSRPEGMSLDRYPNCNGNYEPTNCRWATFSQQNQNRRTAKLNSNNIVEIRRLVSSGIDQHEVANQFGACPSMISRIKTGAYWKNIETEAA